MKEALYAAAVLGSLCSGNAAAPGVIATALQKLLAAGKHLRELADDEDLRGISREEEFDEACDELERAVALLPNSDDITCRFEPPADAPNGRPVLTLVIRGTAWDEAGPLLLSAS